MFLYGAVTYTASGFYSVCMYTGYEVGGIIHA